MAYGIASLIAGSWDRGGSTPDGSAMERDRVQLGLTTAVRLAQQHSLDPVWIVTETADGLGGGAIDEALGDDRLRSLHAGRSVVIKGWIIRHALRSTLQERGVGGAALALYPTAELLDALDLLDRPNAVVVVACEHDIRTWIDTQGPKDLLTGKLHSRLEITVPEVLRVVNDLLTDPIDGAHRLDTKRAQQKFAALRQSGRPVDLRAIRAHVTRAIGRGIIRQPLVEQPAERYILDLDHLTGTATRDYWPRTAGTSSPTHVESSRPPI